MESLWASAEAAYKSGLIAKAGGLARQILEIDSCHLLALHLLRVIANRNGDALQERELLDKILGIEPNHVESLNSLASLLRKEGGVAEAIALCERAVAIRPSYVNAHNNLGICLLEVGRYRDSAEALERAIALNPSLAAAHLNLGYAMKKLGNKSKAAEHFQRAAELARNTILGHESRGLFLLEQRKREEAAAHFRKLVELSPNSVAAHLLLASALEQHGAAKESMEHVRISLALDPNSAGAHSALGFGLSDYGDFEGAIASFERSIELQPVQANAYLGLVTSRKMTNEDWLLVEKLKVLLQDQRLTGEDRVQLFTALSKIYDDLGDYELAMASMDESNQLALAQEAPNALPLSRSEFKGRIERDIRTFTPAFFKQGRNIGSQTELPLLIVGLPRSGTSLMEQIISCHSQVAAGSELKYWNDLSTQKEGLIGLAQDPKAALAATDGYEKLLRSIGPDARRVTDKFPENVFELGMIHVLLPNARIIHCRRNPIDNCISLYLTPFRGKAAAFRSREEILFYYKQYKKLVDHWRRVLPPNRFLEVDYEEVVSDREATLRRVIEFCGLPWEDSCLRPEENVRVLHTPSNWQARQAIYQSSVERWKRYEPWLGAFRELVSETSKP
ncbi:MAG TPA: sulfotransferase [Fimbriimonadaceae bacterium]